MSRKVKEELDSKLSLFRMFCKAVMGHVKLGLG